MPLMQRRYRAAKHGQTVGCTDDTKKSQDTRGFRWGFLTVLAAVLVLGQMQGWSSAISSDTKAVKIPGTVFEIDSGISCIVEFAEGEADATKVSWGPHKVTFVPGAACKNPGLWLRFEGDALVPVVLHEGSTTWNGSFELPVEGNFSLVAYWYGCDGSSNLQKRKVMTTVTTRGSPTVDRSKQSLFPSSSWISSKKFPQIADISQPYVLHNPQIPTKEAKLLQTSDSLVAEQSATFPETTFYKFSELSNYELVCWVGGESAALLRDSFLKLRPLVSSHQRPFKFHYYESNSFTSPDLSWSKDTKERFRKCKHVLISMDKVQTPTTQPIYIQQVTTFINHLLTAFPDDTFPIWLFAVIESPTNPTNCFSPSLPRSSEHPCNTALKDLFRKSPFPERVRFLDSTEITLPQLGENPIDVATAVALRIFVLVGKQVAAWRDNRQIGEVEGLRRGDHLEPNFELVAYTGWAE